jgi:TolB-like protein/AraC-like DNA-binding protein
MRTVLERHVTVAELVQVSGMPERTLRNQFRAFVGLPPLAHLRRMRLAAAREALLAPEGEASVTEVAARFGFDHAGRFSAEYRARFGEPPSATLARGREALVRPRNDGAGRPAEDAADRSGHATQGGNGSAGQHPAAATRRHVPSLAILPFQADGGRLEERLFAEALCEQLAATLSRSCAFWVRIIPHTPRAERPSGVRYGLAGRVARTAAGHVRVVTRLLDLDAGGAHLWGEAYDGDAAEPLALQDRVAEGVALAVQPAVDAAEIGRARGKARRDLGARDLVLLALPFVLAADLASARRALPMLEEAMGLAPDDAVPPALAAWCECQVFMYGTRPKPSPALARAAQLAARAAALDPLGDPLVLTARGAVAMCLGMCEEGDALVGRAQAIDPFFAWAWERSGWTSANRAMPERALDHFARALAAKGARAPMSNCLAGIGTAHFAAGRFGDAMCWIERAIAENPGALWHSRLLPACHLALGDRAAAGAALDRVREAYPWLTVTSLIATLPHAEIADTRCPWAPTRYSPDGPFADGLARLGLPI